MGKKNVHLMALGVSDIKDHRTQVFTNLRSNPPEIDGAMSEIEAFVKQVYYGNTKNIETTPLNELRKSQIMSSTSNEFRKIALSSDALHTPVDFGG